MYRWGKRWIAPMIRWYHRIEVVHKERIPDHSGYVLVANHQNYMDPFYIGSILPHQPYFMAKQEAFGHWILGRVLQAFEAFPVKRGEGDMRAIKYGIKLLRENKVLGIFPEGGRRKDKDFGDLKMGAAFFAQKTSRLILPMYVDGSEKALPNSNGFPRPAKIKIYVGETIDPSGYGDYKDMSDDLNVVLLQLKAEARDGVRTQRIG